MPIFEYPVDKNGNMMDYDGWGVAGMKPNAPFTSALTYKGYSRGRSSVRFLFETEDGIEYSMTMTEFMKILETNTLVNGNIPSYEWHVVKRGGNYGIERTNA